MNHEVQTRETFDDDLMIQYVEDLIKEHKAFSVEEIGSIMDRQQAIHAAEVTCRRLAKETAKKFYYECIKYIMELYE